MTAKATDLRLDIGVKVISSAFGRLGFIYPISVPVRRYRYDEYRSGLGNTHQKTRLDPTFVQAILHPNPVKQS